MVPFFIDGLARKERCFWIADDRTVEEVKTFLHQAGIDIAEELRRENFTIVTKRETYLQDGEFDPHKMIGIMAGVLADAMSKGFKGLRSSGEMTWALGNDKGSDRAMEYEALLNDFFPGKPWVAICQYNQKRFEPAIILDVLRTHRYAIVGEQVCPNLYFEPTQMFFGRCTDRAKLDWRLEQLKRARDAVHALEQTISARDAFFSVASHELRTPITALKLKLELAEKEAKKKSEDTPLLRGAIEQTARLEELAKRLLDVTELRSRTLALELAEIDLSTIIQSVTSRNHLLITRSGCNLKLELNPVLGMWDKSRIEQLIENLLSNALKYGSGKPVTISLVSRGKFAEITVEDEGIGISPSDHGRIFGPFERAVSKDHYSGFGIGLWVVHQIVEAHGGTISLKSALGTGSQFTTLLPCNHC